MILHKLLLVIMSCKTEEQLQSAEAWINRITWIKRCSNFETHMIEHQLIIQRAVVLMRT